jgi:hypothetical protein
MRKQVFLVFVLLTFSLSSCNWKRNRLEVDISSVPIKDVRIHRYDLDLFKVPLTGLKEGLRAIQPEYMFFLGNGLDDTVRLAAMKAYLENPRNLDFQKACLEKYRDVSGIEKELKKAFRHYLYYYPDALIPGVYSYISGGDYENPVEMADSVMIIALDCYLGKDFKPYLSDGVPFYRTERMTAEHIVPDCMKVLIYSLYPPDPSAMTLLSQMVETGKRKYLLDAFLPDTPDYLKMGYTEKQMKWIKKNESQVWAAIIENRMLYSTGGRTIRIFLSDGPYTPEFTKESPPRTGEWIGYRIVKNYMDRHPEITLQQLMQEKDSQKILTLSSYKPGR